MPWADLAFFAAPFAKMALVMTGCYALSLLWGKAETLYCEWQELI